MHTIRSSRWGSEDSRIGSGPTLGKRVIFTATDKFFFIDPERIKLEPDPLTCSAHIRLQADTVTQADGMPSETPASPPTLSQRERVRTGHDEVKTSSCRVNNQGSDRNRRTAPD